MLSCRSGPDGVHTHDNNLQKRKKDRQTILCMNLLKKKIIQTRKHVSSRRCMKLIQLNKIAQCYNQPLHKSRDSSDGCKNYMKQYSVPVLFSLQRTLIIKSFERGEGISALKIIFVLKVEYITDQANSIRSNESILYLVVNR